nr:putative rna-binding protein [Quercus suber]
MVTDSAEQQSVTRKVHVDATMGCKIKRTKPIAQTTSPNDQPSVGNSVMGHADHARRHVTIRIPVCYIRCDLSSEGSVIVMLLSFMCSEEYPCVRRHYQLSHSLVSQERNAKLAQDMLGKDPEKLAQDMLGKNGRRSSTPRQTGSAAPSGTLASRVGVNKHNASFGRTNAPSPRNSRQPSGFNRPPTNDRAQAVRHTSTTDLTQDSPSNIYTDNTGANGNAGLSFKGAAGGPYVVLAQNFAPGTTAADIESVMQSVGGQLTYCRLAASTPTVIAEMGFVEKAGAEAVIETFNNKRADGRLLHVYYKDGSLSKQGTRAPRPSDLVQTELDDQVPSVPVDANENDTMEVDELAESREQQDKLREERRGVDERPHEPFPAAPRPDRREDDYYNRGPRRAEPEYQDGRYGFGGDDRYRGGRGGARSGGQYGGFPPRMYSDGARRGGRGQSYRPSDW